MLDNIFAPIFLPIPASGGCLGAKVIPRRDQEGQEGRKGGFDPHREVPRSAISKPRNPPPEAISRRGAFTIRPLANPISVSSLPVSAGICFVSLVCFVGLASPFQGVIEKGIPVVNRKAGKDGKWDINLPALSVLPVQHFFPLRLLPSACLLRGVRVNQTTVWGLRHTRHGQVARATPSPVARST